MPATLKDAEEHALTREQFSKLKPGEILLLVTSGSQISTMVSTSEAKRDINAWKIAVKFGGVNQGSTKYRIGQELMLVFPDSGDPHLEYPTQYR